MTSAEMARTRHDAWISSGMIVLWEVRRSPSPGGPVIANAYLYVPRPSHASKWNTRGGPALPLSPPGFALSGVSLEEIRASLPPGLVRVARHSGDDPAVVEFWTDPFNVWQIFGRREPEGAPPPPPRPDLADPRGGRIFTMPPGIDVSRRPGSPFVAEPDARLALDETAKPSRFRPRYRKLTPEELALHDLVKAKAAELETLIEQAPGGREKLLALTYLEESIMRAVRAITA